MQHIQYKTMHWVLLMLSYTFLSLQPIFAQIKTMEMVKSISCYCPLINWTLNDTVVHYFLCKSDFMYRSVPLCPVCYSFLLISNKFCDLSLLHWVGVSAVHVHKTTYAPKLYMALYVMFVMRANPLLGQVGKGWAQKCLDFKGPTPSCLPRNGSASIKNITDEAA